VNLRAVSVQETTTLRPAPAGRPEPDFVAFWTAGAQTIGNFS
jgi:hypothetical protein